MKKLTDLASETTKIEGAKVEATEFKKELDALVSKHANETNWNQLDQVLKSTAKPTNESLCELHGEGGSLTPTDKNKKYPELDKIVEEIGKIVETEINKRTEGVKSEMTYKAQYVLEELIKLLEASV